MGKIFAPYPSTLDRADSIYLANFILGYFGSVDDAPHLMRMQKIEDLKVKNLWNNYQSFNSSFATTAVINPNQPDFGINVYAVGEVKDGRSRKPEYERLLELTTTGTLAGGWGTYDFVITLTDKHKDCRLVESTDIKGEFVLGFIRFDSPLLNNGPLTKHLLIDKIGGEFANAHMLYAKVLVPTQPFGSLLRGGKLISLIATSNQLRDLYNKRFNRHIAIFYTTSLYGTSKSSSQYDQLDRYIKFIGETEGKFPLRLKDPQKKQLIQWMDDRGISRYQFTFNATSKSDRSSKSIIDFVDYCLRINSKDEIVKKLRKIYKKEMFAWKNGKTEKKRTYISTYGFEDWRDIIIEPDYVSKPEYDLENLVAYWKKKVFQKKDWGLRKCSWMEDDIQLSYQLIDEQLKDPDFSQVR